VEWRLSEISVTQVGGAKVSRNIWPSRVQASLGLLLRGEMTSFRKVNISHGFSGGLSAVSGRPKDASSGGVWRSGYPAKLF
jgi:hypothetical protein